ncbi:guanine nucleotide-binding protein g(o) subunit alpha [Anaeramoeba flamelloides]|uniref:Guanine nucleotide-binding protein g(O) subunit alpha n=1 Tax=Anaeramoeba flamelloides TaxID=1746091 RepID=A0AAV7YUE5_9EUKA|nr:guanine nucleotide-binding protein g(o) subunit alpha [Anaeramoeba flamelloides]
MGNCCPDKNTKQTNKKKKFEERGLINETLLESDFEESNKEPIRILLLGAGESGKTTFFKQMKLLQEDDFSQDEKLVYKTLIRKECVSAMNILILNAKRLNYNIEKIEEANLILNSKKTTPWSKEIGLALIALWKDDAIHQTFGCKNKKFHLGDSVGFFFNNLDDITQADYLPSNEDILRCRTTTISVDEADFQLENYNFKLIDVGGQRNERKKWSYCYDQISSVIFFVSLVGYSQVLFEDNATNRMEESLALFRDVVKSPYFIQSLIVVYLNKKDLFKNLINEVELSTCFPEYKGGSNYENAIEYIEEKFKNIGKPIQDGNKSDILTFPTCALDTEEIRDLTTLTLGKVINNDFYDLGLL